MGRIVKSVAVAALLISLCFSEATAESLLDYHDYHEMADAFNVLSRQDNVIVEDLGPSTLFAVEPPVTVPILAVRITGAERPRDNGDSRPAIFFDGGIHAREWLTAESMIELAQFLASQSLVPESRVARALEQVDVWIIPMSNPSGRLIDDQAKGDPRNAIARTARTWEVGGATVILESANTELMSPVTSHMTGRKRITIHHRSIGMELLHSSLWKQQR